MQTARLAMYRIQITEYEKSIAWFWLGDSYHLISVHPLTHRTKVPFLNIIWAAAWQNQLNDLCTQRRLRSAWASAQSDLTLCCLHEVTLGPKLPMESTAKTVIRLGRVFAGCMCHFVGFVMTWLICIASFVNEEETSGIVLLSRTSFASATWNSLPLLCIKWILVKLLTFNFSVAVPVKIMEIAVLWILWTGIKQVVMENWATWQNKQNDCAPSEDSDQPGHPPSLIRVFADRMKQAWVLSYPLSAQRRLWSDWADAQADLRLRWTHSHFVGFVVSWLQLSWKFLHVIQHYSSFCPQMPTVMLSFH